MGDNDHETLSNVTACNWDFDDDIFDDISSEAKSFISSLLRRDPKYDYDLSNRIYIYVYYLCIRIILYILWLCYNITVWHAVS